MPLNEFGFASYAERKMRFIGLRELGGHTLKIYSVVFGDSAFDHARFDRGLDLAAGALPHPDASAGRLGVGFSILHQGKTGDYVVLCWWDRENELPSRVFLRDDGEWRPAKTSESFCVWDLEVIWFERNAYVDSILCPSGASTVNYLDARLEV